MMNRLPSPMKEGLRSLIVLTIWGVWRERNSRVFMKECRQVQKIMESIYDEANTWAHVGNKGLQLILLGQSDVQSHVEDQPAMANGLVVSPTYVN